MKRKLSLAMMALSVAVFAQSYSNGPLSTGATANNGATAPTGYTWSEVQLGNVTAGSTASVVSGSAYSLADDFEVPATEKWTLSSIEFFGYQTGMTSNPFTTLYVQLYSGKPGAGGTVIHGDLSTNVMASSTSAAMYRIFESSVSTPGTTRPIWRLKGNVAKELMPGTYWVNVSSVVTNGGSAFFPAVTIPGQIAAPNSNSIQYTGSAWQPVSDPAGGTNYQALPFVITYTVTALGTTETRQMDSRMVVYPNPTKESFKIVLPDDARAKSNIIELYDMSGKLVKTFNVADSYNIKDLQKGAYLIKVKGGDVIKAARIVKE